MPNMKDWVEEFAFKFSQYIHREDLPERFPAGDLRNFRRVEAVYNICAKVIAEIEDEEPNPPTNNQESRIILLKNHKEFEEWKFDNTGRGDAVDEPTQFPCYVYSRVIDWQYEVEEGIYLYYLDVVVMRNRLKSLMKEN